MPPTSGRAAVLGHDCATEGPRIRALVGYMPEHDCLPPDISATEFVTHMGRMSGLPATAAKERVALGLLAGALAAAVIYNALFVMLSALTTRAIAIGLIYLLVWEGLLANLVPGVGLLSAGQYSLSIANGIASNKSLHAHLTVTTAVVMGVVVTLAALVICTRKLAVFSIRGDAA